MLQHFFNCPYIHMFSREAQDLFWKAPAELSRLAWAFCTSLRSIGIQLRSPGPCRFTEPAVASRVPSSIEDDWNAASPMVQFL